MAKKKNRNLTGEDLVRIAAFMAKFKDFDFMIIPPEEYHQLDDLFEDREEGWLTSFDRVGRVSLMLPNSDYINVAAELGGKEHIHGDMFIKIYVFNNDLFLLELHNDRSTRKKRSRKTRVELELELEEAVETQNFELAAKLRDRLKKMQ